MNYFLTFLVLFSILCFDAFGQDGDTVWVQTFTFDDPNPPGGYGGGDQYKGSFTFPDADEKFQRVLMYYNLKCDTATNQDTYNCGEWDYLSYIHLVDSTGRYDSTRLSQPNFVVKNQTPNQFALTDEPTFTRYQETQQSLTFTTTTSLGTANVGNGTDTSPECLQSSLARGRSQFLWTATELTTAGLTSGNITGMRLFVEQVGSALEPLTIRIKASNKTEITPEDYETTGFTEVYRLNTTLATGEQTLQFKAPFAWDGSSNLAIELLFDQITGGGNDHVLRVTPTAFDAGIRSAGEDRYLSVSGGDYVEVPQSAFATLNNQISVLFWAYGDPAQLPQNNTIIFEGYNEAQKRVLNVHLPWSDQNVYWDAGITNGNYDRINKAAPASIYEGGWHHWAFVKNATTGIMQIYLDGTLWHSGTGNTGLMEGVKYFRIGRGIENNYYYGSIDDFALFNKALDPATIAAWKNKDIDNTHPDYNRLLFYYPFNEPDLDFTAYDAAGTTNGSLMGYPARRTHKAKDLWRNFSQISTRPNIVLEQRTGTTQLSPSTHITQEMNPPTNVVIYGNDVPEIIVPDDSPQHPSLPTETLTVWQANLYTYTYNGIGLKIDSVFVEPTNTLIRDNIVYYSPTTKFEIGRFITPYGINLDLGPEGFTWVYDITDYSPLLRGSKYLMAGNAQELLDCKFAFIKGTPARQVVGVKTIWNGAYAYANVLNNTQLTPLEINLPECAKNSRVIFRTSGHGGGSFENCAEFCFKQHRVKLNGSNLFSQVLKRECAYNPVYPQGGTWVYDRTNWCPGDVVPEYAVELSPFVFQNQPFTLDYEVSNSFQPQGDWVVVGHLILYDEPNFQNDVAIDDVLSPGKTDYHRRLNPICSNPVVRIRNNGDATLTSATITYGVLNVQGQVEHPACYEWTGSLEIADTATVVLPSFNWGSFDPANPRFVVEVSNPNQTSDEYACNNRATVSFTAPPQYETGLIFQFRSNSVSSQQNNYWIKDATGQIVQQRATLTNNTVYNDTLDLAPGCYVLEFFDREAAGSGNNGLAWWNAQSEGSGYARLRNPSTGTNYVNFNADFGAKIHHQFTIGYGLANQEADPALDCTATGSGWLQAQDCSAIDDAWEMVECTPPVGIKPLPIHYDGSLHVFPNPTSSNVTIETDFDAPQPMLLSVFNILGELVYQTSAKDVMMQRFDIPLPQVAGTYFIQVHTPHHSFSREVLKF